MRKPDRWWNWFARNLSRANSRQNNLSPAKIAKVASLLKSMIASAKSLKIMRTDFIIAIKRQNRGNGKPVGLLDFLRAIAHPGN
jgi:hypothetical protein